MQRRLTLETILCQASVSSEASAQQGATRQAFPSSTQLRGREGGAGERAWVSWATSTGEVPGVSGRDGRLQSAAPAVPPVSPS